MNHHTTSKLQVLRTGTAFFYVRQESPFYSILSMHIVSADPPYLGPPLQVGGRSGRERRPHELVRLGLELAEDLECVRKVCLSLLVRLNCLSERLAAVREVVNAQVGRDYRGTLSTEWRQRVARATHRSWLQGAGRRGSHPRSSRR